VVADDGLRPSQLMAGFFAPAIVFLLAALLAGAAYALGGWAPGRWLALHLAFVGGVSQLVLGASQFFAGAFLATTPPRRRLVRAQLLVWNLGAALVAIGVSARITPLTDLGTLSLLGGLALFAAGLGSMRRGSLQRRPWATRWYYACAGFLAVGVLAGAAMAHGTPWPHGDLLSAHLALNLGGWFGTAIVGTLHTFYPSLTQTRLAYPRFQAAAFAAWSSGITALALGLGFDTGALLYLGWLAVLTAALLLAANLGRCALAAPTPRSLPALLVGAAQLMLVAGLMLALGLALSSDTALPAAGPERSLLAVLLLAGWLGLTVLGSLVHLLGVLARVRHLDRPFPSASEWERQLLPAMALTGVGVLAAGRGLSVEVLTLSGAAVLLAVYCALGTRVLNLAARGLRPLRGALP
jgi:nitrite reductase (NO-forming)